MGNPVSLASKSQAPVDFSKVVRSPEFVKLMHIKEKFVIPVMAFAFLFYFSLPIMTSYFNFLNKPALGAISWAWVLAFAQFVMTWTLCYLYQRKAAQFDRLTDELLHLHRENNGQ